jgi:SNF family Na+-dependent transporter
MAYVQGKSIHEVVEPGPGLIFVTYPQAISMMPFAPFWAVIFFFMLFTLGIDSTVYWCLSSEKSFQKMEFKKSWLVKLCMSTFSLSGFRMICFRISRG